MKLRNIILLAVTFSVGTTGISALDVTSDGTGLLSRQIKDPAAVTTLTLSGKIDASDIFFIAENLTSLTSLNLRNVDIEAYKGEKLNGRSFYGEATIPSGAFSGTKLASVVLPVQKNLIIGETAFMNTPLESISFPENIDSIGAGAFAACNNLTTVTLPSCKMGEAVFADCKGLESVIIEASVVPEATFRGCTSLTTVQGSDKIETIGAKAFEEDSNLTSFQFGEDLRLIGASAFAGTGIEEADLSRSLKMDVLGAEAFANARLKSVTLPSELSEIENGAFFGNGEMNAIELPANVIMIGDHAFNGVPLQELLLPSYLEEIGNYAFAGQKDINEIIMPASIIRIGDYAMEGMTGLYAIDVKSLETIPELGVSVWEGVDQKNVMLQLAENSPEFENADQWKEFNINRPTGSIDNVVDNSSDITVKGRFVGSDLQIESSNNPMDMVRLFDTSGRLLMTVEPRDTTVTIDTADFPGGVFIVNVTLDDSTNASLKLARR